MHSPLVPYAVLRPAELRRSSPLVITVSPASARPPSSTVLTARPSSITSQQQTRPAWQVANPVLQACTRIQYTVRYSYSYAFSSPDDHPTPDLPTKKSKIPYVRVQSTHRSTPSPPQMTTPLQTSQLKSLKYRTYEYRVPIAEYRSTVRYTSRGQRYTTSPSHAHLMLNAVTVIEAASLPSLSAEPEKLRCTIAHSSGEVVRGSRQ